MPAISYTPSLTDLTHPVITDPPELSYLEISLIKQWIVDNGIPIINGNYPASSLTQAGFIYKGIWATGTAYSVNNLVSYGGGVYFAIASSTGQEPDTATTYWSLAVPANSVLTSEGDLLYYHSGVNSRLPIGINGTKLSSNGTDPFWTTDDYITGFTPSTVLGLPLVATNLLPNTAVSSGVPAPFCSFSNPATGPIKRPISRSYANGFHVWLNKQNEVCFRGTSGTYYFGGTRGTGASYGTVILDSISSQNGILAQGEVFVQVHAAWNTILALTSLGNVWAIGANTLGLCGDGTTTEKRVWQQVAGIGTNALWNSVASPIAALHVGIGSAGTAAEAGNPCTIHAIDTSGRLYAWGSNALGQLGVGNTTSPITSPQLVTGPWGTTNIVQVHGSGIHTLVLDSNGVVYGTGYNGGGVSTYGGALGLGTNVNQSSFVSLVAGSLASSVRQIIASSDNGASGDGYYANSYAVTTTSELVGSGYNGDGRLGNGSTTSENAWQTYSTTNTSGYVVEYIVVAGEGQYSTVYAVFNTTAKTPTTSGLLFATGCNTNAQSGSGGIGTILVFTQVSSVSQFSFATNAVNGSINTNITYFDNTRISALIPVLGFAGVGTHGLLIRAPATTNYAVNYWWYVGPVNSLDLTVAGTASTYYTQLFPVPVSLVNGNETIIDFINNGQTYGSLASLVMQCASGKQFALGNNATKQYNDSGLYLSQLTSIPL